MHRREVLNKHGQYETVSKGSLPGYRIRYGNDKAIYIHAMYVDNIFCIARTLQAYVSIKKNHLRYLINIPSADH